MPWPDLINAVIPDPPDYVGVSVGSWKTVDSETVCRREINGSMLAF